MHFFVDCPCCSHRYQIDDSDMESTVCPECGADWMICNRDAEPETEELLLEFPVYANPEELAPEELATGTWKEIAIPARPRQKTSSPMAKLLPPILGGLSAIPIAIAILWYGFGRDLGNAGPTVARYVPWIVPEHLRGRGYRRPPPSPNPAVAKDRRELGKLGSRTEPTLAPSPSNRPEGMDQWQRIQSMRDAWKKRPDEPWSEVQLRIVREVNRIAERSTDTHESDIDPASTNSQHIESLLGEPWFVVTLNDAASGRIEGIAAPGSADFLAWPTESIQWTPSDSTTLSLELKVEPQLRIDAWPVHWETDPILSKELQERDETTIVRPSLLLGKIESVDELGYLIRVHAILP